MVTDKEIQEVLEILHATTKSPLEEIEEALTEDTSNGYQSKTQMDKGV